MGEHTTEMGQDVPQDGSWEVGPVGHANLRDVEVFCCSPINNEVLARASWSACCGCGIVLTSQATLKSIATCCAIEDGVIDDRRWAWKKIK